MVIFVGNNLAFDDSYLVTEDNLVFHRHPKYVTEVLPNGTEVLNKRYDIAVIVLNKEIDTNNHTFRPIGRKLVVNTICLPKSEQRISDLEYRKSTFFEWGKLSGHQQTKGLQRADIRVAHESFNFQCPYLFCFTSLWQPGQPAACSVI